MILPARQGAGRQGQPGGAARQSRARRRGDQARGGGGATSASTRGPAVVFADYNDMAARIDDPALAGDGRLGARAASTRARSARPGMPEWGQLPIPKKILATGVRDMLRISDARMSGTSYGACVLHVAPESYVGGPLALVEDGDMIELDVPARRLELKVGARRARAPPRRVEAAGAEVRARLRRALPAAHHAGRPGLRFRFSRRHGAYARSGDSLEAMPTEPCQPCRTEARRARRRDHARRGLRAGEARPSRAGSSIPISSATIRTACCASASISNGCAKDGSCGPIRRRRSSSTATRSRSSTATAASARSSASSPTKLGIAKARAEGHRDDRPAQLRASRARSAIGRTWRPRRARCRCTFSTRRARSASRPSAAATGGCRPIRLRSACRIAGGDPVDPRHHDVDGRRRQADGRAEQGRAACRKAGSSTRTARRRPIRRTSTTAARC